MGANYSAPRTIMLSGAALGAVATASAGTWAAATSSGVMSYDKTSGEDTATLEFSLSQFLPTAKNADTIIDSITYNYTIGTAAITSITSELHITNDNATTGVPAATTYALAGTGSDSFGKTATTHKVTVYPSSTTTFGDGNQLNLEMILTPVTEAAYTFKLNYISIEYREVYN